MTMVPSPAEPQGRSRTWPIKTSSASPAVASSSRPSRSSCPPRLATATPCFQIGATSSSSPTRPIAAGTTSSTASPATCATPCRRPALGGRTRAALGDYISIYDIARAVEDGATVPIYYEGRLAKLELSEAERPKIDPDFEEVTEGEEVERKEGLKSKWAQLAAVVGSEKRLKLVVAAWSTLP